MTQDLYNMPMTHLNYHHNGKLVPTSRKEAGIDSFEYNGQTFKAGDIVVVDGQIGDISLVNEEEGCCGLGMSLSYDDVMARNEWSMSSGHRCKLDGLRHATDEEKELYDIDANAVCGAFEEADRRRKQRFETNW